MQVPAGTLREGEDPEAGALREAEEETGLAGLRVIRFLGRYQWDISPIRAEIQDRHVFQLAVVGQPPPRSGRPVTPNSPRSPQHGAGQPVAGPVDRQGAVIE